jgi:hypothetical protein
MDYSIQGFLIILRNIGCLLIHFKVIITRVLSLWHWDFCDEGIKLIFLFLEVIWLNLYHFFLGIRKVMCLEKILLSILTIKHLIFTTHLV